MSALKINKLTAGEIKELNVHSAQRLVANNVNLLSDIGNELLEASMELGAARLRYDKAKHYKDIIIEQNRALKSVISNG